MPASRRLLLAFFASLLLTATAHGESLAVRGLVRFADGQPLQGARVELARHPTNFTVEELLISRRTTPPPIATELTNETGRFELIAPGSGTFRVRVTAPDAAAMRYFLLPLASPVELPPVTLPRNVGARLILVDGDGQPLREAAAYIQNASRTSWGPYARNGWRADARIGWTDDHGIVDVQRIPSEKLRVHVFLPGRAAPQLFDDINGGQLTVTTGPAPRRTIEVRGPDGLPAPGVMVAGPLSWPLGRTGEDGRLDVALPAGHEATLHLLDDEGRRQAFAVTDQSEALLSQKLDALIPITGRVTRADGEPIPGALVWPTYDPARFTTTRADGVYRLEAPPLSRVRIQAEAEGYLPRALEIDGQATPFAGARRGEVPTIALDAGAEVIGRVVHGDGTPFAGAEVVARWLIPIPRGPAYLPDAAAGRGVTDAEGRFRLAGLDATAHVFTIRSPGFTDAEVEIVPLERGETRELDTITLTAGRLAFGRVVYLDQQPLEGAEVELTDADEHASARSDETGRFELFRLPGDKIDITARREGFAPLTVRGIEIPPGHGAVDLGTLVLGPGAVVTGIVTDPEGMPITEARVYLSPNPGHDNALIALRHASRSASTESAPTESTSPTAPGAVTDERGEFIIVDLTPGTKADLLIDQDGYLAATMTGVDVPNDELLQVVLLPAARVAGRVEDEAGRPIANAEVSLWPAEEPADPSIDGLDGRSVTGDDGKFEMADIADGSFLITAYAPGYQLSAERPLAIIDATTVDDLRFVLARGAALEGWVSDRDGQPIGGARVSFGRPEGHTDDEGHYRLDGLPTGGGEALIEHSDYNRSREVLEIEAGVNRADFVLAGGHEAGGRVIDEDELGVAGALVEIEAEDPFEPRQYQTTSASDGSFHWPRIADGSYRLRATKDGYATARPDEAILIDGGPARDIEVVLRRGATVDGQILGLDDEELEYVRVEARNDEVRRSGRVDYKGNYEVTDLAPGDWQVRAWLGDGRREATARMSLDADTGRVTRDLEFGGGLSLTGEVLYGEHPLVGAELTLAGLDVAVRRQMRTDGEGRFQIEDLHTGRYRLSLAHFDRSVTQNQDLGLHTDRHLTIEIDPSGISGTVVSAADSEPIADALIMLRQQMGAGSEAGSLFTSGSDASGAFRQDHLPAGRYRLIVRADGFQPTERWLDLTPGLRLDGLEVPLRPAPGLDLVVRLASGAAPRIVNLRSESSGVVITDSRVPNHQGQIRFTTIPPGSHRLLISAPGGAMTEVTATVPGEPVAVVLPDTSDLAVRVTALLETDDVATVTVLGADGRPFTELEIGGTLRTQWTMIAGRTTVSGLPAGSWLVTVTHTDGRVWSGHTVTTGGPRIELALDD